MFPDVITVQGGEYTKCGAHHIDVPSCTRQTDLGPSLTRTYRRGDRKAILSSAQENTGITFR